MRKLTMMTAVLAGVLAFTGTATANPANSGVFGTNFVDGGETVVTNDWATTARSWVTTCATAAPSRTTPTWW